ncbi:unnamed protein product [Cylicocyclus nassatus]|uniref:Uncharacterized protein n=1 Tax=Cylicocyclus nassatus TaxID=53992 RepID=A0AA36GRV6_CYLNA|nr:unnamed protein product [Cylicocyclus nassatus]
MLPLAAAAYSDNPGACVKNHFNGQDVKFYKVDCRGPLRISVPVSCSAYTAVIPSRNAIVLSFRGTDSVMQLLKEGAYCGLNKKWFGGHTQKKIFG